MTRRNLEMYRGDTYPFRVEVTNAGSPVNLSGCTFTMTGKYDITDTDGNAVFSISSPTYIIITDATEGILSITIPPSATSSLPPRTVMLYYDIQMIDGTNVYTISSGFLTIYPDVSITA